MDQYKPGDDVGALEFWPFDAPQSEYRVIKGNPKTYGRIDAGGPGHTTRYGIWRCSTGAFNCIEQGDELMTVLSGRCKLIQHDTGMTRDLGPGDSLFVCNGSRVTWDVTEDITKVFFGHKAAGY